MPAPRARLDHPDALAEGRWEVHGVSPDPRRAAPRVRGRLDARLRLGSRLALTVEGVAVEARFTGLDELGDWRFQGVATDHGRRTPVTVHARHHGMYRHGERTTAWLSLRAQSEPADGQPARRRLLRGRPAGPRRLFEAEVNAEIASPAPDPAGSPESR